MAVDIKVAIRNRGVVDERWVAGTPSLSWVSVRRQRSIDLKTADMEIVIGEQQRINGTLRNRLPDGEPEALLCLKTDGAAIASDVAVEGRFAAYQFSEIGFDGFTIID